ncbi:LpqB family beta-propeller domain-containing protein [Arthrobacter sp. I2-34]|uniref:LpqB family beta-propeller domain-containing protein n=1 Tax=Arthrobacter hankyongi TaxID=2904801 RepID=A0ABS9L7T8_9MICC|nr:LpqB family beta-propeller domain-containing protein [Arthrobacter hankyongi]MCG2622735.1 LpqB family beta-propeller domain-containing protein [Arthrobacter hankyongi]
MRRPDRRRSRFATTALRIAVVLLAVLLTACSSIPTSGPVSTYLADDGDRQQGPEFTFNPPGPAEGATPQEIVQGFLLAGTATQDDYKIAREFLAPSLAGEWQPVQRTLVYRNTAKVVGSPSKSEFVVQLEVEAVVDERGILQEAAEGTTESVEVNLVQVDGQWRIAQIPDGTMLSATDFRTLFDPHDLYFYDATYTYAVPDVRWFASRQGVSAAIVAALLEGPAPYLAGAVLSAFPEGTTLVRRSVPVESGEATVDLSSEVLTGTTFLRRQQMQQQLELTLAGLHTISTIKLTVDQRDVDLGGNPDPAFKAAVRNPAVGSTQIALLNDELVYYEGSRPQRPDGLPSVAAYSPRDPAMSLDQRHIALLNGQRTRMLVIGADRTLREAASGSALTAPSVDPFGWAWTAAGDGSGAVYAVDPDRDSGARVEVGAQWLTERTVKSLKISREGSRALIIADDGGETMVYVAGVVRDRQGRPKSINTPIVLKPAVPVDRGVWAAEGTVVVMAAADKADTEVTAQALGLDSSSLRMAPLAGMLGISVGNGAEDVYAQTRDSLYVRVGNSWAPQSPPVVQDRAFPG